MTLPVLMSFDRECGHREDAYIVTTIEAHVATHPCVICQREAAAAIERERARTVNAPQLRMARRLAAEYGHEWAVSAVEIERDLLTEPEPDENGGPVKRAEVAVGTIADYTRAARYANGIAGWAAPQLDEAGRIVHTSMGGRFSWVIERDGTAEITVHRPAGWAIRMTVPPYNDEQRKITVDIGQVPIYERHVTEAFRLLAAATSSRTAFWKLRTVELDFETAQEMVQR